MRQRRPSFAVLCGGVAEDEVDEVLETTPGAGLPAIDDARPPLGIAVERSTSGAVGRVRATSPTFVLPLYATALSVRTSSAGAPEVLDSSCWLLVPSGQSARWRATSPMATTLVLTAHDALSDAVVEVYRGEVDPATLRRFLATAAVARRTTWVNEVAQRYAFERAVCRKHGNAATAFLEVELLKEWYFLRRDEESTRARASHVERLGTILERAQAFVDAHLDEPLSVDTLVRAARAAPRALLRAFHSGFGVAPASYIRARRLDEALLLLRSGRYGVSEVALRVGYGNLSAFSQAFRERFGAPPSRFKPVAAGLRPRRS
jgi:AraC-like DNA-binding protein